MVIKICACTLIISDDYCDTESLTMVIDTIIDINTVMDSDSYDTQIDRC